MTNEHWEVIVDGAIHYCITLAQASTIQSAVGGFVWHVKSGPKVGATICEPVNQNKVAHIKRGEV